MVTTPENPLFFGRYEIIRELGRGQAGTVYLAKDPLIDRTVAVKVLRNRPDLGGEEAGEWRARFEREVQVAGKLNHPGIVSVLDVGLDDEAFIVMEHIEGRDLESLLEAEAPLALDRALDIGTQIADALDAAHRHGVVHRDVKPGNILVTDDSNAKVTDFGVAHLMDSRMTQAGVTYGTPAFMSPEQAAAGEIGPASDQFSLAAVTYLMLTGELPFSGASVPAVLYRLINSEPIPPESLNPTIPPALSTALLKSLSKNPRDRYRTCSSMLDALRSAVDTTLQGEGPAANGMSPAPPTVEVRETSATPETPAVPEASAVLETTERIPPRDQPESPSAPVPGDGSGRAMEHDASSWTRVLEDGTALIRKLGAGRRPAILSLAVVGILLAAWMFGGVTDTPGAEADPDAEIEQPATTEQVTMPPTRDSGAGPNRVAGDTPRAGTRELQSKFAKRAESASTVLDEVLGIPEGIPADLLRRAECVAVIPNVIKVGFGIGGRHGRGLLSCRTSAGWSLPAFVSLTGGSFGLQIGAQASDMVLVFANRRAAERLASNKITLGGDASVSAGPVGRTAEAGTDVRFETEIYSYSRSKGLFAGVSLEGATLRADEDANRDAYDRDRRPADLLVTADEPRAPELAAFVRRLESSGS